MRVTIAILLGGLLGQLAAADLGPLGPEFQVNTYTTGEQSSPRVAADGAGRFVVVWGSGSYYGAGPDGSRGSVSARRFDSAAGPLGQEFLVNTYTIGPQDFPDVATGPGGEFLVAWQGGDYSFEQDGSFSGAFLQRFTAAGAPVGGEGRANTTTAGFQTGPVAAIAPAGDAVVVWESFPYFGDRGGDGDYSGIFAQRYDPSGVPVGPEFQVNTFTSGVQSAPAVVAEAGGGFVVVWESGDLYGRGDQDGSRSGVFGQRFDANGQRVGAEFQVNTYTTGAQGAPAVAAYPAGGFVVVWQSGVQYGAGGQDGSLTGVFGQRFDGAGARLGGEFQVNTYTTGEQEQPDVAADGDGNLLVTWRSGRFGATQDGSQSGIFARHLASTGEPVGPEFQVNTYTTGAQRTPAVSSDGPGTFVVVWASGYEYGLPGQDGDGSGIFARRLEVTATAPARAVAGDVLVLRDAPASPRGRRLSLRSADAAIGIGLGEVSGDDPTRGGGSLRVRSVAFDVTYPLPAEFWRPLGSGGALTGWTYRDSAMRGGPITKVVLRHGALRARGKGAGLVLDLAVNPDPVEVTLQIGGRGLRQCMRLGGATVFKPGRRFRAEEAPAPPSCGP